MFYGGFSESIAVTTNKEWLMENASREAIHAILVAMKDKTMKLSPHRVTESKGL